jgi:hypothetical protein
VSVWTWRAVARTTPSSRGATAYWFDKLLAYPGMQTPNGPTAAGLVIAAGRDYAVIHVDVIGVGSSVYDFLNDARQDVVGVNVAEGSTARDKSGRLGFFNLRSELVWRMREALDPTNNTGIALPPDSRLLADLCAFTWKLEGKGVIRVESREEIIKRIGRSPDYASAVMLALIDTPQERHAAAPRREKARRRLRPARPGGPRDGTARCPRLSRTLTSSGRWRPASKKSGGWTCTRGSAWSCWSNLTGWPTACGRSYARRRGSGRATERAGFSK